MAQPALARPGLVGTCVRGTTAPIFGERGARGGRALAQLLGSVAPPRTPAGGGQSPHAPKEPRPLGHIDRALWPTPREPAPSSEICPSARGGPRAGFDLFAECTQASPLQGRREETGLRAVRAGGALARPRDGAHPRPRQRGRDGQPPRKPAHRLSQLRGDPADALRKERGPGRTSGVPSLRVGVSAAVLSAALLLAGMRPACRAARAAPGSPQGGASSHLW